MYGALDEQGGTKASLLDSEVGGSASALGRLSSNVFTKDYRGEFNKKNALAFGAVAKKEAQAQAEKLKTWAEKGDFSLRVLISLCGFLLTVSAVLGMLGSAFSLSPLKVVLECYLLVFGVIIIVLENPQYHMKSLEDGITKYAACLNFLWGRAIFCIFCGSLRWCLQNGTLGGVVGIGLVAVGVLTLFIGCLAHKKLNHVKLKLADKDAVRDKFKEHDKNGNGGIDTEEVR
jgi:hypothetical protein